MTDTSRQPADALVLFGITGDLAKKMLLPALYQLVRQDLLTVPVIGVGRSDWDDARLRDHARDCVAEQGAVDEDAFARFAALLSYVPVDYDDPATFTALAAKARPLGYLAHYIAVPPETYATIARRLAEAGLHDDARLIVEKPFGHDRASARDLQAELTAHFPEERLRRVDHFLGKSAVDNLLTIRLANPLLSAVLCREYVCSVQLTMAEDFDVADRGGFYDATGCLRDVVENHLLQTLVYFLMEAPRTGSAADLLDERTRTLRAIRTARAEDYVRGQYAGYQDVDDVAPGSTTETYAALILYADTARWSGVPIAIRAGKAMATTAIELIVELTRAIPGYHHTHGAQTAAPNLIRLRIGPDAGLSLTLLTQHGDDATRIDENTARLDFTQLTGDDTDAYRNVLHDALTGKTSRFVTMQMVDECWRITGPLLNTETKPLTYEPGSWGPSEAERLVPGGWHPLELP
ncbi:glucose-6-phosphate dehydrogenase [Streptomyces sp. A7024]|uniref:Glucose-6-phosphate 1-dehydrogenase n=1 Tax=Streptomyces coryli TaxID=1128680 RepID=A0A6G4TXZ9_9ACTN|nr:glucose-6-phosphate dehydrogenase [Streptomyces coryli]NGN64326.1 glucose-6-phosphate dehydrogenase [Streptomyces coryli]